MKKYGQSSIEYVIIFAIVAGALIAIASMVAPRIHARVSGLSGSLHGPVSNLQTTVPNNSD